MERLMVLLLLTTAPVASAKLPHIVFLLTDDQDVMLGGLDHMPQLRRLLQDQGTTMTAAYAHTPICCPSRSSFLTGRYIHNSLTTQNGIPDGCSNETWGRGPEKRTYAVHLSAAGYETSYSGKYLNQYALPGSPGCSKRNAPGCFTVPPGWSDWHGLQGNSRYYNGTISDNGVMSKHGDRPVEDYLPDIFFSHTKNFIKKHLAAKSGKPFLAVLATPSCHGPFTPAPKYAGDFASSSAPRTPNWNASTTDKQWLMRQQAPISDPVAQGIDNTHNHRLETLLSVDDYVGEIVKMLDEAEELDNTFIIYTSDHGFQLGQHRLPGDKRHLYEHDIRIPFVVRGPGVPENATNDKPILNVDVAPTMYAIAYGSDAALPDDMDGRNFLPLITEQQKGHEKGEMDSPWRSDFLVDYHGAGKQPCGLQSCPPPPPQTFHVNDAYNNTYTCLRSLKPVDTMYCEFRDSESFVEYYKHEADPYQMCNVGMGLGKCAPKAPESELAPLKAKLAKLRACKGAECRIL